jgi:hypothetical protein
LPLHASDISVALLSLGSCLLILPTILHYMHPWDNHCELVDSGIERKGVFSSPLHPELFWASPYTPYLISNAGLLLVFSSTVKRQGC